MKIKSTLLFCALSGVAFSAYASAGFTSIDQICGGYSLICARLDDHNDINHFTMNAVPGEGENEILFKNFFISKDMTFLPQSTSRREQSLSVS